jgi:hypothetical protein
MMMVLVAFTAPRALAEGVDSSKQGGSTLTRLPSATTLLARPGGLLTLGGSSLRYLATGASRWETLHRQPGDNLYRAELDDSGRVLAAWEKDPFIHLFTLQPRRHTKVPKPLPPANLSRWSVERLLFLPGGDEAVVLMQGFSEQRGSDFPVTGVFRITFDGKGEPTLLFRTDDMRPLHTSRYGVVFEERPRSENKRCMGKSCRPLAAIVAYEFTGNGISRKTLLTREQAAMSEVATVRGSNHERVVLKLELSGRERALLRFRYGDAKASYRPLPPSEAKISVVTDTDEFIELRGDEYADSLEVVRYPPEGGEQVTSLPALHDVDIEHQVDMKPYSLGVRGNGGLWVHWGDSIALLTPGKPPLGYNLEPFISRRTAWAGVSIYVGKPEALWVGIDGKGRDFIRLSFDELEKRSKPWR